MEEEYTLENARAKLDAFEKDLESLVPNPTKTRLVEINKEYAPQELRDLLQHFSSYLAILHSWQGKIEAECLLLSKGLKTGISIASVEGTFQSDTISGKEAEILAGNNGLRSLKMLEIYNDSFLVLIKSWVKSYEAAYTGVSRIISIELGEISLQTARHS